MMKPLTEQQEKILAFIKDFKITQDYYPSIRELQKAIGFKSTSSVTYQLNQLQEKGYIEKFKNKKRALVLTDKPILSDTDNIIYIEIDREKAKMLYNIGEPVSICLNCKEYGVRSTKEYVVKRLNGTNMQLGSEELLILDKQEPRLHYSIKYYQISKIRTNC